MKKLYTLSFLFLALIGLTFMSNSSGRATVGNEDTTGSPLSNRTCAAAGCHSSGSFTVNLNLEVKDTDGNLVTEYTPGTTYEVTLTNNASGSPAGYGFQMVSLLDDNSGVNEWTTLDNFSQTATLGSRTYVEQAGTNPSNTVTLQWTAPAEGSGNVSFYAVGNAVNGNGNTAGDGVGTTSLSLSEKMTSSVVENQINSLKIYPNPANDFINIDMGNIPADSYTIVNIQGQTILNGQITNQSKTLDISSLQRGLYFVYLQDETRVNIYTQRLIVK